MQSPSKGVWGTVNARRCWPSLCIQRSPTDLLECEGLGSSAQERHQIPFFVVLENWAVSPLQFLLPGIYRHCPSGKNQLTTLRFKKRPRSHRFHGNSPLVSNHFFWCQTARALRDQIEDLSDRLPGAEAV